MTDRELLEAAAKAVGYSDSPYWHENEKYEFTDGPHGWNPLTDDGDALRLAVKLGLTVMETTRHDTEGRRMVRVIDTVAGLHCELHGDDPYAATRRAITRAAAEMGKAT